MVENCNDSKSIAAVMVGQAKGKTYSDTKIYFKYDIRRSNWQNTIFYFYISYIYHSTYSNIGIYESITLVFNVDKRYFLNY